MNKKKITLKISVLLIASLLFLTENVVSQNTLLVEYGLTSNTSSTNGIAGNHPDGSFSTDALNLVFAPGSVAQTSNWDSGTTGGYKSWQTSSFSTIGYHSIKVGAVQYSSASTGPRDFVLEYKIGNLGTWTNVEDYTVTNIATNRNYFLPQACSNESNVSVRWRARSYTSLTNGTVNPAAKNFIKTVSVNGLSPVTPVTQASQITFSSTSATTLTVECIPGTGDNRLIVIRKPSDQDFISPTNGVSYTANPVYSGLGQQIVYNGSGNSVVVTVPDATDEYYFQVYDYNQNAGMTRYITSTSTGNPKLYALEEITATPATNVRLVSATLGASIKTPTKGEIYDRGIIWSTSPGVSIDDNMFSDYNPQGGAFTLNFPDAYYGTTEFPRGSTIYYKGYVQNESGTILSQELSFTNVPTFSGTGNWENLGNWNVQQVPGSGTTYGSILDKPTINGVCTLTSQTSCNSLIINSGRKLIISPAASLNVTTNIANSAGNSGILLKSNATDPSGSLIFNNLAGSPVSATVEMYSKAKWDLTKPSGSKYSWQFFGIPVKTLSLTPTFSGAFVRKWEEAGQTDVDLWVMQNTGTTLTSITGYELVQSMAKTYSFAGQLENQGFTRSLPYSAGAVYPGQHIFGNPFVAAIDIEKIQFGANTENAIYLYNTGTYNEWDSNSGETATGEGHGQYTVTTPKASGGLGIPNQIPSMQGFLVKSINATGSITIPYISSVANSDIQRIKANNEVANSEKIITRIDIKSTHYSDRMWIFTDPGCTRSFDNGWDGRKMLGSPQRTQLFSMEEDGNYQINAVRDITDTYIGFQPGDDREFKLIFTHQNTTTTYSGIYLIDLKENKSMDVTISGSEYSFTSDPSVEITKRFKIITKTTEANYNQENNGLKLFFSNSALFVQNFTENDGNLILYKTTGATLKNVVFKANTVTTFSTTDLAPGIYLAKAFVDNKETTQRIIIR